MSINFYLSRQSGGQNPAREKVIDKIIKAYKSTPLNLRRKIFVLTPRQNTYQVERELIQKVGQKGLLGLQITDFDGLILKFLEAEANNIEVIDSHGRLMLMQKSLLDIRDQLEIYQASVKQPNFKNEVTEQISELKQAQVTPELLEEKYDDLDEGLLKSKLHDIGLIYKTFTQNLGEDRYDEDDISIFASSLIKDTDFFDGSQIFVVDNSSFNYLQILFLVLVDSKAKSIDIALTTDQDVTATDSSAFKISNNSLKLFDKLAKEYGAKLDLHRLRMKNKNSSLDYLASGLFSYNPKPYMAPNPDVYLYEQKDPWEEVKIVAQLILEDYLQGIPFSKIAVISNSPEVYDALVNRIFSQFKIPTFFDENHKVIDNHFIQAVLSALDIINTNFNKTEVLSYIKSEFSNFKSQEAELVENYVIEAGVRNWEWKNPFKRVPKAWRLEDSQLAEDHVVNQVRSKLVKDLDGFIKNRKKNLTFSEWIKLLNRFLTRIKAQDTLERLADEMSEQGELELSSRYRQIWNILVEILKQIEGALGNEKTTFADFLTVLKSGITSYTVGVIPEDDEAVIISSIDRAILPDVQSVYFLGLNEGMFPKSINSEALLTDFDRDQVSKLLNVGFDRLKNRHFNYDVEESNFYRLLTKATDKVSFTYNLYDMEGNETFPSRYVDVLTEGIFSPEIKKGNSKYYKLLTPERANIILESLVTNTKFEEIRDILEDWFKEHPETDSNNKVEKSNLKLEDVLEETDAFELFQSGDKMQHVSVSRLESFADCAFKHFLKYGLNPQEREEYEVRSIDTGIIIHEVFNKFLSNIAKESNFESGAFNSKVSNLLEDSKDFHEQFNQVFNEVIKELDEFKRYFHSANSRYLVEKIKQVIFVAVRVLLVQIKGSNFTPVRFEQYFRENFSDNFIIEGRIDRIDLDEDNNEVRVIDYKTKGKTLKFIDLLYGRSLQLAIYLVEAIKMLSSEENELKGEGAYYFRTLNNNLNDSEYSSDEEVFSELKNNYKLTGISTKEHKSAETMGGNNNSLNTLSSEEFDSLLKHSDKLIKELSNDLVNGKISINPIVIDNKAESCEWCPYNTICKFDPNSNEFEFRDKRNLNKSSFFEELEENTVDE